MSVIQLSTFMFNYQRRIIPVLCEISSFLGWTLEGKLQQHTISHATGVALEEGWRTRKKEGWSLFGAEAYTWGLFWREPVVMLQQALFLSHDPLIQRLFIPYVTFSVCVCVARNWTQCTVLIIGGKFKGCTSKTKLLQVLIHNLLTNLCSYYLVYIGFFLLFSSQPTFSYTLFWNDEIKIKYYHKLKSVWNTSNKVSVPSLKSPQRTHWPSYDISWW